jgi:TatA/E family protein of Tat protein translocase
MSVISPVHILFLGAFALIFLGPKRLPEVARSLGDGMRQFREVLSGEVHHIELPDAVATGTQGAPGAPQAPAPPTPGPFG